MAKMTSLERVATALQRGQPDQVPVATLAITRALWEIGERPQTAIDDAEKMAKAKIAANENFGDDIVVAGIDGCFVEAKAMGAKNYWSKHMPIVDTRYRVIKSWEDVDNLTFPAPEEHPRMRTVIEEAGILMDKVGDHIAVAVIVSGPYSTACNLMGHESMFRAMVKEPEKVHSLLDKITDYSIKYHTAFKGRAHAVALLDPVASTEATSPKQHEKFVKPYLARDCDAIAKAGMIPINHPCGDTTGILQMAADVIPKGSPGAIHANYGDVKTRPLSLKFLKEVVGESVALDPDDPYSIMLKAVKKMVGDRVCVCGNIDPISVMLEGTPDQVRATVKRNIDYAAEGGGFIVMPGCDTNPDTPSENFKALVKAAREYGVYR
ncbi:uroporphyrinogen decarboxylase family protein [Candidatus Hecatella orcuttiae]|jgi:uroporphyrinogen decarboxylase|uniref:uroporphyrinogen decarboxylase family protein n=1 Tax=Candidatus Hecatella orcuttiae TaxID=1935119 RepID=UPI00286815DB|nr:uroporphyrinogen decarboxylase family protein [Candidatus Hecatella orcuttiae]